MTIYHF